MTIENAPFATTSWNSQPETKLAGESGYALVKCVKAGEIRLRMIEFTSGYRADHWCSKGHVVLVLSGCLTTLLQDGRVFETAAGHSFHVSDGDGHHRSETRAGATVIIVD